MSLYHSANKLNQLSKRRYGTTRNIPKILMNYHYYRCITSDVAISPVKVIMAIEMSINTYTNRRLKLLADPPVNYVHTEMPGERARLSFWTDPRVEFGLQNRRRR